MDGQGPLEGKGALADAHARVVLVDLDGGGVPFQADDLADQPLLADLHDVVQAASAQPRRLEDGAVDPYNLAFDHFITSFPNNAVTSSSRYSSRRKCASSCSVPRIPPAPVRSFPRSTRARLRCGFSAAAASPPRPSRPGCSPSRASAPHLPQCPRARSTTGAAVNAYGGIAQAAGDDTGESAAESDAKAPSAPRDGLLDEAEPRAHEIQRKGRRELLTKGRYARRAPRFEACRVRGRPLSPSARMRAHSLSAASRIWRAFAPCIVHDLRFQRVAGLEVSM